MSDGIRDLLIQVRPDTEAVLEEMRERFISAFNNGTSDGIARHVYPSLAMMLEQVTLDRWALLEHLHALGEVSLRTLARALKEKARSAHADVIALIDMGIVERTDTGRFCVPYERIRVEFEIEKEKSK